MPSDEELMEQVARGEAGALAALFERYRNPLFGFCYRLLGERSAAEDAVQDTFLRIFDRRRTFRAGASFVPWMYVIARNLCSDRQKAAVHRELPMSQLEAAEEWIGENPDDSLRSADLKDAVREAVGALPTDQRMTVILREYQGLSYREIARVLDCSEEAVRVRVHRARQTLRKRLAPILNAKEV